MRSEQYWTRELEIVTLKEAGIDIDIPEPFHTLEENASAKSKTIFELTGTNCFSEDTGLEVSRIKWRTRRKKCPIWW